MATAETSVRARIRGDIKEEASIILKAMALSLSDALDPMAVAQVVKQSVTVFPFVSASGTLPTP